VQAAAGGVLTERSYEDVLPPDLRAKTRALGLALAGVSGAQRNQGKPDD